MFQLKSILTAARSLGLAVASIGVIVALSTSAHAAPKPAVYTERSQPAAVGGYDLTSYFAGDPVRGAAQFAATYTGVTLPLYQRR